MAFCGFIPGFGYLTSTDWSVEVPRRSLAAQEGAGRLRGAGRRVRRRLPAGVARRLAADRPDEQTMFDAARDPAAILRPGVRIRFVDEGAS